MTIIALLSIGFTKNIINYIINLFYNYSHFIPLLIQIAIYNKIVIIQFLVKHKITLKLVKYKYFAAK